MSSASPQLAVVITVHGRHEHLRRCLSSLADQVLTRYLAGDPVGRGHGRRARHDLLPLSLMIRGGVKAAGLVAPADR
ncbi:hypothetical protein ACTQ49_14545 [Luteococcus sp. Sow4_B9]|uniref:hypothetical protein n=1 Tax=Luteococcus sp. Sow4_B9 TaxID=3438792 RepID=UPI003F9C4B62